MTYRVALGTLEAFLGDVDAAALQWSSAIGVALGQGQVRVAEGVCRLLLPLGQSITRLRMLD